MKPDWARFVAPPQGRLGKLCFRPGQTNLKWASRLAYDWAVSVGNTGKSSRVMLIAMNIYWVFEQFTAGLSPTVRLNGIADSTQVSVPKLNMTQWESMQMRGNQKTEGSSARYFKASSVKPMRIFQNDGGHIWLPSPKKDPPTRKIALNSYLGPRR